MQLLSKTTLILYLLTLVWLVLFKFSIDLPVVLDYQMRSLNLIPFTDFSPAHLKEVVYNFVVFIPFGLLLSITAKRYTFRRKLILIAIFSLAAEVIQFTLAIGRTDMTDLITNTLGGFVGLMLYSLCKRYINDKKLDKFIVVASMILLVLFILLRLFVLRASYQS